MRGDARFKERARGGLARDGGSWRGHQVIIFLFFWFTQLTCLISTSWQRQQEATAARLRGQLRASAGCRRCWMAIPGLGRGDSTTLAGHLSRRRKTSNRNQVAAGASPDLLEGRKPKEKPGLRASPHEPCHWRRRTVAHATCATHKTDCSRTYDTMTVQLSLERCGVVLLDRS